jgi:hypothetical protein
MCLDFLRHEERNTLTAMLAVQEKEMLVLFLPEVSCAPFVYGCLSIATQQTVAFEQFLSNQIETMSSSGEEDETGPNVDSLDPDERIHARRERIKRRIEATKRY